MPSFAYSAINSQGVELSGEIQAPDLAAARDALRGNGLLAQRLEEITRRVRVRWDVHRVRRRRSSRSRCRSSRASSRR